MDAEVLSCRSDPGIPIMKYPLGASDADKKLLVAGSQEAFLVREARIVRCFGAGEWAPENIGENAGLWFVNKAARFSVKWGTGRPVIFTEPVYGIPVSVGARGELTLCVEDGSRFLPAVLNAGGGTESDALSGCIRALFAGRIGECIARYLESGRGSIFDMDGHLPELSAALRTELREDFAACGLALEGLSVTGLAKPEEDREFRRCRKLYFRAAETGQSPPDAAPRAAEVVGPYVFISYSTRQQEAADSFRELLLAEGLGVWMAPYSIAPGEKYAAAIERAIRGCSCFALLLSEAAQASQWVDKEVERALSHHRNILTLQLENVALNAAFSFYLSNQQFAPVQSFDPDSPEIQSILRSVRAFLAEPER